MRLRVTITDADNDEVIESETFWLIPNNGTAKADNVFRNREAARMIGLITMRYEQVEDDT